MNGWLLAPCFRRKPLCRLLLSTLSLLPSPTLARTAGWHSAMDLSSVAREKDSGLTVAMIAEIDALDFTSYPSSEPSESPMATKRGAADARSTGSDGDGGPKCPDTGLDPLTDVYCGRGGGPCPDGYDCVIHPADAYAICCLRSSRAPSVFPTSSIPPTTGASSHRPTAGASSYHPTPGVSSDNPTPGVSSNHPTPGASSNHPTSGASSNHPTPGAADFSSSEPTDGTDRPSFSYNSMPSFHPTHSFAPTAAPSIAPSQSRRPSYIPSSSPSIPPTPFPTPPPTEPWENASGNGGCPPTHTLHEVTMFDSWGDGWSGVTLTLTPHDPSESSRTFTLDGSKEGRSFVCLRERRCYGMHSTGFVPPWNQEMSWTIRPVILGIDPSNSYDPQRAIRAEGMIPINCTFSLPSSETDGPTCENTCRHITPAPSSFPSIKPSSSPTSAPIEPWENVAGNGGCLPSHSLHELNMVDSWGDGWSGIVLTLSATDSSESLRSFTLLNGHHGREYVCLKESQCYRVESAGGLAAWNHEISWNIQSVKLGVDPGLQSGDQEIRAEGSVPVKCTFHVPASNSSVVVACMNTCGV